MVAFGITGTKPCEGAKPVIVMAPAPGVAVVSARGAKPVRTTLPVPGTNARPMDGAKPVMTTDPVVGAVVASARGAKPVTVIAPVVGREVVSARGAKPVRTTEPVTGETVAAGFGANPVTVTAPTLGETVVSARGAKPVRTMEPVVGASVRVAVVSVLSRAFETANCLLVVSLTRSAPVTWATTYCRAMGQDSCGLNFGSIQNVDEAAATLTVAITNPASAGLVHVTLNVNRLPARNTAVLSVTEPPSTALA